MTDTTWFARDQLIRFHHCDPAGIVFYPQYFVLINELVEDWFNHGLEEDYARFHAVGRLGTPMARLECDFLAPSTIGEMLTLRLAVERLGRSSITLRVEGLGGGAVRVRARMVVVTASLDDLKPVPVPEHLRARIARFLLPRVDAAADG